MGTRRLTISLPERLYDEIGALAEREERTLSELSREALRLYAGRAAQDGEVVDPWERRLVGERLAAYQQNPADVVPAEAVHATALERLRKKRR